MDAWTNEGDHRICCLPCGHLFGLSCIKEWLKKKKSSAKCPQCNRECSLKDVRKLFAPRIVAIDNEAQEILPTIRALEVKCALLEKVKICGHKEEAPTSLEASAEGKGKVVVYEGIIEAEAERSIRNVVATFEAKGAKSFTCTQQKCKACEKTVYQMEYLSADGAWYHNSSFKCFQCKKTLMPSNFFKLDGVVYCKRHFDELSKVTSNVQSSAKSAEKLHPELTGSPSKAEGMFSGTHVKCAACGETADLSETDVEEILELLKSTWRLLDVTETIHYTCYAWVLFR